MMLLQSQKSNLTHLTLKYSLDHLKPPADVYSIAIEEKDYFMDMGADGPRRVVYYKVSYTSKQVEIIEQLKGQLQKRHPQHELTDQVILKNVYSSKWDIKTVLDRLDKVIEFTQNPVVTNFTPETARQLKKGFFYCYGHDRQLQPIVVLRVDQIDFSYPLQQIMNTVYYVMLVVVGLKMTPYHAERLTMIVDFNHLSLTGIPILSMYDTLKKIGVYYTGFLCRTLCVNAEAVSGIWSFISRFLSQTQRKKFIFIDKHPQAIKDYIDPDHLQKKYGGNLPNLTHYWPPKNTQQAFQQCNKSLDSDYESVANDYAFFNRNQSSSGICGPCSCVIY